MRIALTHNLRLSTAAEQAEVDAPQTIHAIAAVGYDDSIEIKHSGASTPTKGALIIRNSWGTSWGDRGYGYLPYEYVLSRLAVDWWVLIKSEWLDQAPFKQYLSRRCPRRPRARSTRRPAIPPAPYSAHKTSPPPGKR